MTETLEHVERHASPRKQRWGWLLAIALLGALALTVSGILPFRQLIGQQNQIARAEEQLAALQRENTALSEDIYRLSTDAEVERIAREQYGLVRPGEVAYVIVVPDAPLVADGVVEPVVPTDERPWWQRIWEFIAGSDVDADG
ncbi:MAG: septum formation initiator family protein [Actinomycetota bacterium]